MNHDDLKRHPAYLALTPTEQAAVDARLTVWPLDARAVAAATGEADVLEASDLRWWLASSGARPWTPPRAAPPVSLRVEFLLRELAPTGDASLARAFSRAAASAEADRTAVGFVRDEQLAALARQLAVLDAAHPAWNDGTVLGVLQQAGLDELVEAIEHHQRSTTGVLGLLRGLGERVGTRLFDLRQGGLFAATGHTDHEGRYEDGEWSNWTRSYAVRPRNFHTPVTPVALADVVASAKRLRVVGGGHTFNDSPLCSDTLVSLDALDGVLSVDRASGVATVQAGVRLRDLTRALWAEGLAMPMLGSTDAQSIGGLIATDLHGTGRDHGFLSERVRSLGVIAADGTDRTVRPGDPLFHAAFGALGTCGVVHRVELQAVPAFNLVKTTAMVDRAEAEAGTDALIEANDHVSFYYVGGGERCESIRLHTWNHTQEAVTPNWARLKTRAELSDFAISAFAPGAAELLSGIDEDAKLSDALAPDHRLVMPATDGFGRKLFYRHDEIEYGVPYARWQACVGAIIDMLGRRSFFSIVEVRFTPDHSQALLGPGVGRRTAYVELATPLSLVDDAVYAEAHDILVSFGGQPHLGKKTNVTGLEMEAAFGDRFRQFRAVREAQDPDGKFLNPFTRRVFGVQ